MVGNISKEKREQLLNKINEIKSFISEKESDGRFTGYLNELANEINSKKYGLVFESHRESVDEILDNNIPVFTENEKHLIPSGKVNFLLEGDNLATLTLLQKTHKGAIDVIYIDPPYNTGNNDFVYDDKMVDNNDSYRHSKWLSFMDRRLRLAHCLLKESGVILISIDDNEKSQLKLLCDGIFGEENSLGVFVVKSTPNARDYGHIGKQHEYMLFYGKDSRFVSTNMMPDLDKKFKYSDEIGGFNIHPLYNSNEAFTNLNRPNLFYPFYLNPLNKKGDFYEISLEKKEGWIEIYPPKSVKNGVQFVWRWGREKSLENINKEIVGYCNGGTEYRVVQKMRHSEKIIRSILDDSAYTTRRGTAEVESIMGNKNFSFPKPLKLIRDVLYMATKQDSVVLDFFAGSGTTGQAVMELNKEDCGNRQFILCTNNQNEICEQVTFERLKRVIENENYQEGLKYFKIDYVDTQDKVFYEYSSELLQHIKELVELENGIDFKNNQTVRIALTEDEIDEIIANPVEMEQIKKIYVGHDVMLGAGQVATFNKNNIEVVIIPNYYYSEQ